MGAHYAARRVERQADGLVAVAPDGRACDHPAVTTVRMRATADADGELRLRGLPVRKGDVADVIVLIDGDEGDSVLSILQNDPSWAWLKDPDEDLYTERDAR
jgi:hypothetical protein